MEIVVNDIVIMRQIFISDNYKGGTECNLQSGPTVRIVNCCTALSHSLSAGIP